MNGSAAVQSTHDVVKQWWVCLSESCRSFPRSNLCFNYLARIDHKICTHLHKVTLAFGSEIKSLQNVCHAECGCGSQHRSGFRKKLLELSV